MATTAARPTTHSAGAPAKTEQAPANVIRWTGAAGVSAALILLVGSPLYFIAGTPPAVSDASKYADFLTRTGSLSLTTKLVDALYVAAFIVFLVGVRELIRRQGAEYEWAATMAFAGGLVTSAVILFGDVLAAGAALDTYSSPDPVVIRALTEASLPAFGAISLTMTVLFLVPASWGIVATRALPRWTGWTGYAVAVISLIAAGTVFGGNDFLNTTIAGGKPSAGVYSYSYAIAGAVLQVWLLVVGICMVRAGGSRGTERRVSDE